MKLRTWRIGSQVFFFALFIFLLFRAVYPLTSVIPVDLFLRLDPLIALTAMISARAFITIGLVSLITLVLTAVLGRFFCAYICPLGTTIDFCDALFFKRYRKGKHQRHTGFKKWKYLVLTFVLVGALFGLNLVFLFDPIAIVTRIYTLVVVPPAIWLSNVGLGVVKTVLQKLDVELGLLYFSFKGYHFIFAFGTLVFFFIIAGLNIFQSRFWCRNICPLGALLSILSRVGIFRRVVTEQCDECGKCRVRCPMQAIPKDVRTTVLAECTLCGNCTAACDQNRITRVRPPRSFTGYDIKLGITRRNFLHSFSVSAAGALVATSNIRHKVINERVVRPPGTLPENKFLARCVRCGECMKVCKTNCLQPTLMESGWYGFWSPRGVFRVAGCEKTCNLCGQVCPTGAIRSLPLEEKQYAKMGTAVINRHRCIAWEQNLLCLICDEICPYDAIEYRVVDQFTGPQKKPFVLEDKCVGCGMCEQKCPVRGKAAIYVLNEGEERMATGSYITEKKKRLRQIKTKQFETEAIVNFGEQPGGFVPEKNPAAPEKPAPDKLPSGFITE